jgi:hypothetical protein
MINRPKDVHAMGRTVKEFPIHLWDNYTRLMKKFAITFDVERRFHINEEYINLEYIPAEPQGNSILVYRDLYAITGIDTPISLRLKQISFEIKGENLCISKWGIDHADLFIKCFLIITQYSFPDMVHIATDQPLTKWMKAINFAENTFGISAREIVINHLADKTSFPVIYESMEILKPPRFIPKNNTTDDDL